ncbi:MAG: dihydropteroate synthase [Spirochaetota bacterium]
MSTDVPFGNRTYIMGVINLSADSFYAGSRLTGIEEAIYKALSFEKAGADIVDVGGESTRPGSRPISAEDELKRILPVIEGIKERTKLLISVDTYKTKVAARAIDAGVQMVNNITGLLSDYSEGLAEVIAEAGVYVVLMHMRGMPFDMQSRVNYYDVVEEVSQELDISINKALDAGIKRDKIIIDPGIGFAKKPEHNLSLIKYLPRLKEKGYPVLVGLSRKSFLGVYTGQEPEERLIPTVAANAISIFQGADIVRVHDVWEAVLTARIVDAIKRI